MFYRQETELHNNYISWYSVAASRLGVRKIREIFLFSPKKNMKRNAKPRVFSTSTALSWGVNCVGLTWDMAAFELSDVQHNVSCSEALSSSSLLFNISTHKAIKFFFLSKRKVSTLQQPFEGSLASPLLTHDDSQNPKTSELKLLSKNEDSQRKRENYGAKYSS